MLSPEYTDGTYLAPIIDKGQEVLQMHQKTIHLFPYETTQNRKHYL
jgi:hypothetical protein